MPKANGFTRAVANTPAQMEAEHTGRLDAICVAEKITWKKFWLAVMASAVFIAIMFGIAFWIGEKLP